MEASNSLSRRLAEHFQHPAGETGLHGFVGEELGHQLAVGMAKCRVINRRFFAQLDASHPALKAKILKRIALQLCERLRQANIEISALRS